MQNSITAMGNRGGYGKITVMKWAKRTGEDKGFTIVELLIVIVVIAILAAITIVAYNGIQSRARGSQVQSTVSQAVKKIKSFAVTNSDTYPTSITACPNPGATEICLDANTSASTTYAVENGVSPRSFCASVVTNGAEYYTDETGQVLPGSCSQRSCYEIQQNGGSRGSGTYWIRPAGVAAPIRAYCDMVTSGGGWTLVTNNVGPNGPAWNASSVQNTNQANPSLDSNYSIWVYANDIKSNLSGNKLNYRMDSGSLGRWGGVWEAPYATSLESTAAQGVATLVTKYDTWTESTAADGGTLAPSLTTVPWFSGDSKGITTWNSTGSNWWGTIANYTGGSWTPAPYISGNNNLGPVRYWVK